MKIVSDSLEQKVGVTRVSECEVCVSKCVLGVEGDGTCVQVCTCSMYVCTYVRTYCVCLQQQVKLLLIDCGSRWECLGLSNCVTVSL